MKTIALIFGSTDSEHDISIMSAASVYENFPKEDYKLLPIYIKKDGTWISGDYDLSHFEKKEFPQEKEFFFKFTLGKQGLYDLETQSKIDLDGAFLMLHGPVGEGGMIQGLLELANIPFVGSELTASAICMDKAFTHQICEKEGIQMAKYQLIRQIEDVDFASQTYPVVVKPSREGSSFGISYAHDETSLIEGIKVALEYDSRVLIEEYIDGQELSVAIFQTKNQFLVSKPVQATRFNVIADFEEKYLSENQETLFDLPYPQSALERVMKESEAIFKMLDCKHLSRIDFFITQDNHIYFNEINTIPGFTKSSLYPMMIAREGIPYKLMIKYMIEDIL